MKKDYEIENIAQDTYRIHEFGASNMYLIIGDEHALLIDTGVGLGDLRAAISKLTSLPLLVAATHAHPDHIGGKGQFEEIFLHEDDYKHSSFWSAIPSRRVYTRSIKKLLNGISQKDIKTYTTKTNFRPMPEIFSLGNREVKTIHIPGHTHGSVVFIDEKEKVMFTGDNVNPTLFHWMPGAVPIEEWIPGAETVKELSKEYTPYHGHDEGLQSYEQISKSIMLAKELLQKEPKNTSIPKIKYYPEKDALPRIIYRSDNIFK